MPPPANSSMPSMLTEEKSVSKAANGRITIRPVRAIIKLTATVFVSFEFLPTEMMATADTVAESIASAIPIMSLKGVIGSIKTQSSTRGKICL